MPTNYPGNPAVSQPPSPAPGPGVVPIVAVPQDGVDFVNAASVYQEFKTEADYIAHIQKSVLLYPPQAQVSTTLGFGPVTHVGGGTGTVTPSGTGYKGLNVVVKIIGSGGVGAATFQYSTDGGATFSATQTTSASFSIGFGILLAFAGTFVATDTYQFQQAFTAFARFVDFLGSGRFTVDHNGFDGGLVSVNEHWRGAESAATASPMVASPWHAFNRVGTTFNYTVAASNLSPVPAFSALQLITGANANGDSGYFGSPGNGYQADGSTLVSRIRFEISPNSVGANNLDIWGGWCGTASTLMHSTTNPKIAFNLTSGASAPWNMVACNGSTTTTTSTGVVASASTWTRLQIEIHGAATPVGAPFATTVALFFINDVYVGNLSTNIPSGASSIVGPYFGCRTLSSSLSTSVYFGHYSYRIARFDSVF